jgi:hypothetical protein
MLAPPNLPSFQLGAEEAQKARRAAKEVLQTRREAESKYILISFFARPRAPPPAVNERS